MGVKSPLTLQELQQLFPHYAFTTISATKNGIIDTTYIVKNSHSEYILKKYERPIQKKIILDAQLLRELNQIGLNVSSLLEVHQDWHLYTKLKGRVPNTSKLLHMVALGRFLARFHTYTQTIKERKNFLHSYSLSILLQQTKIKHYFYYKKLAALRSIKDPCQGFIHGDIFKDNTLFNGDKLAIFDFIDGGCGSFAFELGVVMISFNPTLRKSYTKLLLQSYNQKSPKKITDKELASAVTNAAKLYGLLRITHYTNTNKAKELAKLW